MENKKTRCFAKVLARIVLFFLFRIEFKGEKGFPKEGAFIVCANHTSLFDIPILTFVDKRWLYFMAKKELFQKAIMRRFVLAMGAFPVSRGKGDIKSIKTTLKHLKNGNLIGLFPQGTRERKGRKLPARKGAAMLAAMSGAPIIPVLIEGNFKWLSKITVTVGKPYDLNLKKNEKYSSDFINQKSQEIMKQIYALRSYKIEN